MNNGNVRYTARSDATNSFGATPIDHFSLFTCERGEFIFRRDNTV